MPLHELIFSEKRNLRVTRHLLFWTGWWVYGCVSFYFIQYDWQIPFKNGYFVTPGNYLLLKTFLLILVYLIPSYAFLYAILPALNYRNWLKAIILFVPAAGYMFMCGWLMYWHIFPLIDSLHGNTVKQVYPTQFWPAVILGWIEPMKIIAAAAIIKYLKYWWQKQKEKEKLEQEKLIAELQLMKSQIHPAFLLDSLNHIYEYNLVSSPKAPEMLLKLSDLLSYMLYECDETFVPLEKEIERMEDYILLEKIRIKYNFETNITVRGELKGKIIAPFILLPFIENSFKISSPDHAWMNMDISVKENFFTMQLANGLNPMGANMHALADEAISSVQKRLTLIYPQMHDLKISMEEEMLIVVLKIQLFEKTVPSNFKIEEWTLTSAMEA